MAKNDGHTQHHHAETTASVSPENALDWALDICRQHGLRRTKALRVLLQFLLHHGRPIGWSALAQEPEIKACCDPSSAFRVLIKLEQIGLVRRVGSTGRSYYFEIQFPGKHHDYLICTDCGKIDNLDIACPVEKVEHQITVESGYQKLYHELDFFGVCPDCQAV